MKNGAKLTLGGSIAVALFSIIAVGNALETDARRMVNAAISDDTQVIFEAKCAKCHGKDGRAKTFRGKLSHARNFTDAQWQTDVTDERLFNSISNGRNEMPAFKKKLAEDQINSLVGYIRKFKK